MQSQRVLRGGFGIVIVFIFFAFNNCSKFDTLDSKADSYNLSLETNEPVNSETSTPPTEDLADGENPMSNPDENTAPAPMDDTATVPVESGDENNGNGDTAVIGNDTPPVASPTDCAGHVLCDSFASGTFDPSRWTSFTKGSVLVAAEGPGKSDGKALHAKLTGGTKAFIRNTSLFQNKDSHFFGRAWFFIPRALSGHTFPLWVYGKLANGTDITYGLHIGAAGTSLFLTYIGPGVPHGGARGGRTELPTRKWLCFEWEFDPAKRSAKLWIDGKQVQQSNSFGQATFSHLDIGLGRYRGASGPEVYWDDIVFSRKKIGCE